MLGIALAKAKNLIDGFAPLPKGIKNHPYNKVESLETLFSDKTSAVILELVQWQSGITKADQKFISKIKQLARKHKALIIIDEVQSGIGRTGTSRSAHRWTCQGKPSAHLPGYENTQRFWQGRKSSAE